MRYEHMLEGTFMELPNRFIAYVNINGTQVTAHVKNTGRCRELLIPGTAVIVKYHPGALEAGRKTEYSLIGVYKGDILINMDSQAPNQVAEEWLRHGGFTKATGLPAAEIHREVTYGNSRFDLSFLAGGEQAYMEVKGVTLEVDHVAKFPAAPTERGVKHVKELSLAAKCGWKAYILFVIQMKGITSFTPNMDTHPAFGEALREARQAGVHIMAYDCIVTKEELSIDSPVEVCL